MKTLGCLVLFILCLGPARCDDKTDGLKEFQGHWRLAGAREEGKETDVSGLARIKIVFKGDMILVNGQAMLKIKVDTACNPKIIDLTVIDDARVVEGIYRFQGKKLTICLQDAEGVRMRPVSFGEVAAKVFILEKMTGD